MLILRKCRNFSSISDFVLLQKAKKLKDFSGYKRNTSSNSSTSDSEYQAVSRGLNNYSQYKPSTQQSFKLNPGQVQGLLHQFGIEHKVEGSSVKPTFCPLCSKPHNNLRDNMYTLVIDSISGIYHCFRCSSKGNWYTFKQQITSMF